MTTNQEGRQAAIRESTGTTWAINGDWHALWDAEGIDAGSWDERMLSWLNAELGASYTNLMGAMHAYAAANGYSRWTDIGTFSLSGASSLLSGEDEGLAFDFTDQSVRIKDTGTPANAYNSTGTVSSGALVGPGGKLTYTSPSNKLTRQSDGYYKYQAHNLVPVSATYTSWTKQFSGDSVALSGNTDPRGTATYVLTCNGTSGVHALYYNNAVAHVAGATYTNSVVVKKGTLRYIQISEYITVNGNAWANFDLDTGLPTGTQGSQTTPTVTDIGNGYFLCAISYPAGVGTTGGGYIIGITSPTATRAPTTTASGTYEVGGFHIRRTPSNDDYIETAGAAKYALPIEYDTSGNCLGLLVEEQRTNSLLQNISFTGWTVTATTPTSVTGLDNISTSARRITETTASSTHLIYAVATTFTAAAWTVSAYLKGTDWAQLYESIDSVDYRANFDLQNGVVGATAGVTSAAIEACGGGWYRCSMTFTPAATIGILRIHTLDSDRTVSDQAYVGSTSRYVDIYLPQVELGAFPTSPILTYGAAATRNADPLSQLSTTFPLSATAGSLYAYVAPYAGADLAGIVSLNDGSGDEEIVIYKDASANIVAQVEDGGVNQLAPLDSTVNASSGTAFKVALAWAANDFALSADGTAAQTDTGGTLPTVTTLEIGVDQANNYFNGHIKAISYVPRRKSDAELATETA